MIEMDENDNNIDDSIERKIEIGLTIVSVGVATTGLFTKHLSGTHTVALISIAFALYQGTSLAKIVKGIL